VVEAASPFDPSAAKGGLPECKADLNICSADLAACEAKLAGFAPVARTGQTECWDALGAMINCAGTGQDGDIQAGIPYPDPRFTDNGNGTTTDDMTGLVWLTEARCRPLNNHNLSGVTWVDALTKAAALKDGECGLTDGSAAGDWRVPNVKALMSLVDYGNFPTLPDVHPFIFSLAAPYTRVWTSTTWMPGKDSAFTISFETGDPIPQDKDRLFGNFVWPVKGP
jgi:hypothetical protein